MERPHGYAVADGMVVVAGGYSRSSSLPGILGYMWGHGYTATVSGRGIRKLK